MIGSADTARRGMQDTGEPPGAATPSPAEILPSNTLPP